VCEASSHPKQSGGARNFLPRERFAHGNISPAEWKEERMRSCGSLEASSSKTSTEVPPWCGCSNINYCGASEYLNPDIRVHIVEEKLQYYRRWYSKSTVPC